MQRDNTVGATASRQPALVASLPEPVPASIPNASATRLALRMDGHAKFFRRQRRLKAANDCERAALLLRVMAVDPIAICEAEAQKQFTRSKEWSDKSGPLNAHALTFGERGAAMLQCAERIKAAASGIEARRAATAQTGSVEDESPVAESETPNLIAGNSGN